MMASESRPRSASGLSWTVNWPRFNEAKPLVTPTVEPTVSTAGSASSTSTTRSCRADMAAKETLGSARVLPWISPVSSIGRKPFGAARHSITVPTAAPSVTTSISPRQRSAQPSVRA